MTDQGYASSNYFVFVASHLDVGRRIVPARSIAQALLSREIWLFSSSAPHRGRIRQGDQALIYLAGKDERVFIAAVRIDEAPREATQDERAILEQFGLRWFALAARLDCVQYLEREVSLAQLVPKLSFIQNKKYYGHYVRQAVRRIPVEDYQTVLQAARHG